MGEDRVIRMEGFLERLATELAALRAEIVGVRAEMATNEELGALRAEVATKQGLAAAMATLRGEMATKEDLAACAKNVDVVLLGSQMRDLLAMKDDLTVLTAIAQRLDNTVARQSAELTEIRAEHSRMDRLLNRVRTLETAQLSDGG